MVTSVVFFLISWTFCKSTTLSSWTKTNVTLSNSYDGSACGYNNHSEEILILGGYTNNGNVKYKDIMSYSITNDNIQSLPPLPTELSCFGRCYTQYKEKVYFTEFYLFGIYNVELKQSTYPLSTKNVEFEGSRTCIAIYDDKYIFAVGGFSGKDEAKTNKFQIYDIEQDIVFNGAVMTSIRSSLNCAISNKYLYAIGGDRGSVRVDTIEKIYIGNMQNIVSETWQLLESKLSVALNHHECIAYNQYIYILGGVSSVSVSSVIRLNTATDTLFEDTSLPIAMSDICGVITDDERIFVIDTESVYWAQIQTNYPTMDPTNDPTNDPSAEPTKQTHYPTKYPTVEPTKPTDDPTNNPTEHPTIEPTKQQTLNPSLHSTKAPTYPLAEATAADYDDVKDDTSVVLIYIAVIVNILLFISCISAAIMFLKYYRKERKVHKQQPVINRVITAPNIEEEMAQNINNTIYNTKGRYNDNIVDQETVGNDDEINDRYDVNGGEYDLEYIGDDVTKDGEEHVTMANVIVNSKETYNMNIGNDEFIIKGDDDDDETKGNTIH